VPSERLYYVWLWTNLGVLFIHSFIHSFISGSAALCWALAAFSVSWSFTQSVGLLRSEISPSQGRYIHTEQHKHNKRTQTPMPCVGFEPTIPASERAKTVDALDSAATVIGLVFHEAGKYNELTSWIMIIFCREPVFHAVTYLHSQ
jgi:hypothetical protein